MPFFSCILLSHDKAAYVGEAIDSLLRQTYPDWEAVILDSGVLYDRGFFSSLPALKDPRFRLVRSWETEEIRKTKTIASWCFNECFRKKLLKGQYITYLCDDDLLYPNAFQAFHDYIREHPKASAMYASVNMTGVNTKGEKLLFRESLAKEVKGSCCEGGSLDCQVDYLQLCHKADLFGHFSEGEFWPEDTEAMRHADGILLEKIGKLVPIYPVPAKIGENRKVPVSLNEGGERLDLVLEIYRREHELRRLRKLLAEREQELAFLRIWREVYLGFHRLDCLRHWLVDKLSGAIHSVPPFRRLASMILLTRRAWQQAFRQAA
jgi:glycosyltransferase involved in cell wall biosynthesis